MVKVFVRECCGNVKPAKSGIVPITSTKQTKVFVWSVLLVNMKDVGEKENKNENIL